MQTYHVRLQSNPSKSYFSKRAADSLDIDVDKKSVHELSITADIDSPFSIGLILGASGSGKTTLAKQIYGEDCFKTILDPEKSVIDQFSESLTYDERASLLSGIGLTSVPCWIRPIKTLSNGQKARAEAALLMQMNDKITIIDEWTSVVDRTVAKVMSHCVQKHARKNKKQVVLLSCHYDVIEWLNPDWIIDCNKQEFIDRRLLHPSERSRKEVIKLDIKEIDRTSWKYFSKYHYLSERLPGGQLFLYGLFNGPNQIGFQCFANYVPTRKGMVPIYHSNRTVIHPDYCGLGLGVMLIDETSKLMAKKKFKIMAKFSSTPVYKSLMKSPLWKLVNIKTQIGKTSTGGNFARGQSASGGNFRENIKTYSFVFVPPPELAQDKSS